MSGVSLANRSFNKQSSARKLRALTPRAVHGIRCSAATRKTTRQRAAHRFHLSLLALRLDACCQRLPRGRKSIVLSEANAIDKLIAGSSLTRTNGVKESLYSVFLRGVVHASGPTSHGQRATSLHQVCLLQLRADRTYPTHLAQRAVALSLQRSGRNNRLESQRCPTVAGRRRSPRAGVDNRRFTRRSRGMSWKNCVPGHSEASFNRAWSCEQQRMLLNYNNCQYL
jgi:hypothetical protein